MGIDLIWQLGCWLMGIAATLYILTWALVTIFPVLLIGNMATLWLKGLTNVLLGGLFLTILWAVDGIVLTYLSWRR